MNKTRQAWWNGLAGVLIFSGSLPATRAAVLDFDPVFLTLARGAIAGLLALGVLMLSKQRLPARAYWSAFAVVAFCVVVAFPLLTACALQHINSAHSIVFIGLLPLATAACAVLHGERPSRAFWFFSGLGSAMVVGFAATRGVSVAPLGNALMLVAVLLGGVGYAEGARLSRTFGGWQVISWALVLALPLMLPLCLMWRPISFTHIGLPAWVGLAYVSVFSMLIGFVFWYRGLALGGTAAVGQLQLLQPFFGLMLAAVFLHEQVSLLMLLVTVGVIACVAGAKRFSV